MAHGLAGIWTTTSHSDRTEHRLVSPSSNRSLRRRQASAGHALQGMRAHARMTSAVQARESGSVRHRPFRFGVILRAMRDPAEWHAAVRRVEDLGYSVLNVADHFG